MVADTTRADKIRLTIIEFRKRDKREKKREGGENSSGYFKTGFGGSNGT